MKAYQLLAHGRWFSPGTPASSTTNGRHDIAEIGVKHNKSINHKCTLCCKWLANSCVQSNSQLHYSKLHSPHELVISAPVSFTNRISRSFTCLQTLINLSPPHEGFTHYVVAFGFLTLNLGYWRRTILCNMANTITIITIMCTIYIIVESWHSILPRFDLIWFIVFNATFSNISAISWRSVLVMDEAGVNHRPWESNW